MNKVRITREQEEAVNKFKNHEFTLEDFVNSRGKFFDELKSLNTLSVDEMAIVLYTENYKVRSNFVIGDWIYDDDLGVKQGVSMFSRGVGIEKGVVSEVFREDESIRYATIEEIEEEKEFRRWSKLGRDYWELAVGDIIDINDEHFSIYEVTKVEYMLDKNDGYSPAPILIKELKNLIENGNVEVVCFADNREDIHD